MSTATASSAASLSRADESAPHSYSLVHVFAMPLSFIVILILTRLAAG